MHNRHFDERKRNDQSNYRTHQITQNHPRTGELNCDAAAQKEADANCPTDREHGQLTLIEKASELLRALAALRQAIRANHIYSTLRGAELRLPESVIGTGKSFFFVSV